MSLTQGGARSSLALGYYLIVLTGLQFGSLRSRFRRTLRLTGGGPEGQKCKQSRTPQSSAAAGFASPEPRRGGKIIAPGKAAACLAEIG